MAGAGVGGVEAGAATRGDVQTTRVLLSPRCRRRLPPPPPAAAAPLKASRISANDLRSFPDLASAIQRIMNNALTLKLQK